MYGKYFNFIKSSSLNNNQSNTKSCHGDLTYENMIIKQNNLYFIDFLDGYVDSKLLDISKIFQLDLQILHCSTQTRVNFQMK